MGASSWRYYTPYRNDPEAALQELRQRVFEAGEYSMGGGGFFPANGGGGMSDPAAMLESGAFGPMNDDIRRIMNAAKTGDFTGLSAPEKQAAQQMKAMFDLVASLKKGAGGVAGGDDEDGPGFDPDHQPETIDELLEMVAEDGTHSILDIERTAARNEFGAAIPLPDRDANRYFGTERPDHDQVEARWADVSERLERWEAYYVTVYKDGEPAEYAFIGCSGD